MRLRLRPTPKCSRCGKPWKDHYAPELLRFKYGPFGTFGLTADHTPHLRGVHAPRKRARACGLT